MINFKRINLLSDIKNFNFQVLKPISETNSCGTRNGKNVIFSTINTKLDTQVSIRIEEVNYGLTYNVVLESICKDIDIQDYEIDRIIKELSLVSYQIIDILCNIEEIKLRLANEGQKFEIDTLIIPRNIEIITNDDILKKKIKELYHNLLPGEIDYSNYSESLFLIGNIGKRTAEILYEIGIARYERIRGSYLLNFNEEKAFLSNRFIVDFKSGLSEMGIPVFATVLECIHHLW